MPRAPLSLSQAVAVYFVTVAGLGFLGVQLSLYVTANAIALALPALTADNSPPPSRIAQRQVALAHAIPPMPVAKSAAPLRPGVPLGIFVAQLDSAEAADAMTRPAPRAKKRLAGSLRLYSGRSVPAADAFNRNFGVIPVASN
jgi:hypothetical protein